MTNKGKSRNRGKSSGRGKSDGRGKSGSSKNGRDRMSKRGKFAEIQAARKRRNMIAGIVVTFVFVALIVLVATNLPEPAPPTVYNASGYEVVGDEIHIPKSDITTSAKFFSYNTGSASVKFFAVVGSDGDVHTAFDACEVCYDAKKGYYQQGAEMVCRNCGQRFTTNQIGTANRGGGCWPSYLERSIVGDNIVIKISEMNRGAYLFD